MPLFLMLLAHLPQPRKDERGATMVEYGILVAVIAVVVMVVAVVLGTQIAAAFQQVVTALGG